MTQDGPRKFTRDDITKLISKNIRRVQDETRMQLHTSIWKAFGDGSYDQVHKKTFMVLPERWDQHGMHAFDLTFTDLAWPDPDIDKFLKYTLPVIDEGITDEKQKIKIHDFMYRSGVNMPLLYLYEDIIKHLKAQGRYIEPEQAIQQQQQQAGASADPIQTEAQASQQGETARSGSLSNIVNRGPRKPGDKEGKSTDQGFAGIS